MNKPFVRYQVGDTVRMKKIHPCGSDLWEITRTGIDFGLKCTGCGRRVMIPRAKFERGVKELFPLGTTPPPVPTKAPATRTHQFKGRTARPTGSRPTGPRPTGSRPTGSRPTGSRPTGPRPEGPRSSGTRPAASRPSALPPAKSRSTEPRSGPGQAGPLPSAGAAGPRPSLPRPRPRGYRPPDRPPTGPRKP